MKISIFYTIILLLLCISCTVEQQLGYSGYNGNNECMTVRVRMSDKWKIVNSQLNTKELTLEFDRGRGIETQRLPLSFPIDGLSKNIQFRGANRVDGLAILHFTTDEDKQNVFNPPMAKSGISKGLRTRDAYAIFRTGNWLMLHFSIENTDRGNLLSQDQKINPPDNFRLINGVLHFVFDKNRERRNLPIHEFIGPHEKFGSSQQGSSFWGNELRWTSTIKIVPKQKKDR